MKILLHIGLEKTGTTSIQHYLAKYRDKLLEQKILYPKSLHLPNNEYITIAFRNPNVIDELRIKHAIRDKKDVFKLREKIFNDLKNEIKNHNLDILLISNEHLSSRITSNEEIKNVIDFLKNFSSDIEIILYLRRQDKIIESLYSTSVKSGNSDTFEEFVSKIKNRSDFYFYDLIKKWEQFVNRVRVKLFEKECLKNHNIIEDFCGELNLNLPKEKIVKNSAFGYKKIEFMRRFNQLEPLIKNKQINSNRGNFLHILEKVQIDDYPLSLNQEQRKRILEKYIPQNVKVAQEYFNRNHLFLNTKVKNVINKNELSLDDFMEIFRQIWIFKQKELLSLTK